jgi:hypothetical protein
MSFSIVIVHCWLKQAFLVHHALPLDWASKVSVVRDALICGRSTGRADLGLPLNRPLSTNNLEADAKCEMPTKSAS